MAQRRLMTVQSYDPVTGIATVRNTADPDSDALKVQVVDGLLPVVGKNVWIMKDGGAAQADWLAIANAFGAGNAVLGRPAVRLQKTGNAAIANNTFTKIDFNEAAVQTPPGDPYGMYDEGVSASRITLPTSGAYLVGFNLLWTNNATGRRWANVLLNGGADSVVSHGKNSTASADVTLGATTARWFAAGDYIELEVFQDSGGPLSVQTSTLWSPTFFAAAIA